MTLAAATRVAVSPKWITEEQEMNIDIPDDVLINHMEDLGWPLTKAAIAEYTI